MPRLIPTMRLPLVVWTLLGAALLGGCAGSPPSGTARGDRTEQCYRHGPVRTCVPAARAGEAQRAAVHALASPPAVAARLVVVRNSMSDFHRHAQLLLDGKPTQELIPCSSVGVDMAPGPHRLLVVPAAASAPLMLTLAPGTLTVVQVRRVSTTGAAQGFELATVSRGQALPLVQECQVLGLIDLTAAPSRPLPTADR